MYPTPPEYSRIKKEVNILWIMTARFSLLEKETTEKVKEEGYNVLCGAGLELEISVGHGSMN